jgi:hypothetical protein
VTHQELNPGRLLGFDARAVFRRLRLVVLLAPSLAVLLVLAAAEAASAADDLDLLDSTPAAPIVSRLEPVKVVAVKAVPKRPVRLARAIIRGAKDAAGSVRPAPIPRVALPDIAPGASRDDRPRLTHTTAPDHPKPTASPPAELSAALAPKQSSTPSANGMQQLDLTMTRPVEPARPLGLFVPADAAVLGGSGLGAGTWLGHSPLAPLHPGWRSSFAAAITDAIPRGLTPRPLVPPG